jgi:hypothetical protein
MRRVGLFTLLPKAMNMSWQDAQNFTAAVETQCQSVFLKLTYLAHDAIQFSEQQIRPAYVSM